MVKERWEGNLGSSAPSLFCRGQLVRNIGSKKIKNIMDFRCGRRRELAWKKVASRMKSSRVTSSRLLKELKFDKVVYKL